MRKFKTFNADKLSLIRVPGTNIATAWILVTPEIAAEFLDMLSDKQRRQMPNLTARYAHDMEADQFPITHLGMAFGDSDDSFIDGQHRCAGIIKSGKSCWMLVTFGLSREAMETIDRGKNRTMAHALQIMGFEHSDHRTVAIARAMERGVRSDNSGRQKLTDIDLRKFIERHIEAIAFAFRVITKDTGPAIVAGCIARAYYYLDTKILERFAMAMRDVIPPEDSKPQDATARRMKAICAQVSSLGGLSRSMLYRKCQNALTAFANGQSLSKIYENEKDLFPLDEQKILDVAAA